MPVDEDCKSFLAYVRNGTSQGISRRRAVAPHGLVHGARRGAVAPWDCRATRARPRAAATERNASRTPPHVYASPSSMNTVWNKNATTHATPICRAKTAAAERPPSSERTVPIAATHGG